MSSGPRSRRLRWPVPAVKFDLPELPEPYFLRYYLYSPGKAPDRAFRYRLELYELRRLLGFVPWPRLLLREEYPAGQMSDPGRRRWAVATFLRRVVAAGYVDAAALPAGMLREK